MEAQSIIDAAVSSATGELYGIWFLIGAALVFFMQCGFAMVETGFTRAKNGGNIIMKNLMDFCIGTPMFAIIGFALMMSENYFFGIIGKPDLQLFTNYANFPWSSFVFNLVFCATAATIVSGAMAERTKFSAYCIYSGVISAIIYPIEAGWVWNANGWLCQLGFIDFAGSAAIHMVGGFCALIGAAILGPRLGKYSRDSKGKVTQVHAIPGHSLTLGVLGTFILWFRWYGFNGAACTQMNGVGGLASVFLTTTLAPAVATCVTMIFTWVKNGKPDVSMSLNASLAGLVAITAPCACTDALGAIIIGAVAGILVVAVVEGLDLKLHIDDPVGAVGVHFANGIWGTIAAGLFSVDSGLFYGHGFHQLGVQLLGVLAILLWTGVTITITFLIIKKVNGLRAAPEEEIFGLDKYEHGIESSYADFTINYSPAEVEEAKDAGLKMASAPVEKAIPTVDVSTKSSDGNKLTKVVIVTRQTKFDVLKNAMDKIGITGMTVQNVMGCGMQKGSTELYRGAPISMTLLPKIKVEIIIAKVPLQTVIDTAKKALYTGHIGDGKIFVYDVENVIKVRTGEEGFNALQDEE